MKRASRLAAWIEDKAASRLPSLRREKCSISGSGRAKGHLKTPLSLVIVLSLSRSLQAGYFIQILLNSFECLSLELYSSESE